MRKKEILAQMKTIGKVFGLLFDEKNAEVCSDCPRADRGWQTKEQGCCAYCASEKGYFNEDNVEKIIKNTLGRYFTKKYGFFNNKKKECKLPRHLRSNTCLWYACKYLKLTDEERIVRDNLLHKLTNLRLEYYK